MNFESPKNTIESKTVDITEGAKDLGIAQVMFDRIKSQDNKSNAPIGEHTIDECKFTLNVKTEPETSSEEARISIDIAFPSSTKSGTPDDQGYFHTAFSVGKIELIDGEKKVTFKSLFGSQPPLNEEQKRFVEEKI